MTRITPLLPSHTASATGENVTNPQQSGNVSKTQLLAELAALRQQLATQSKELSLERSRSENLRSELLSAKEETARAWRQIQTISQSRLDPALNGLNEAGEFPLYSAAAGGDVKRVKKLLEQGANPCMRTRFDWTALHWAAGNGHVGVVELLLKYGAEVNAVSDTGVRPLKLAKTEEIKEMLVERGAY